MRVPACQHRAPHDRALPPRAAQSARDAKRFDLHGVRHAGRELPSAQGCGFLKENGIIVRYLPPELSPGIDYSAFAIDPDGNAIQLYYYMEQIGWDGRPRPADLRRKVDNASWPESIEPLSDTYRGTVFQGPSG